MRNIKIFENPVETASNFGDYFIKTASKRERFHIALSGGSTPRILFDYLAGTYKTSEAWKYIHLFWGDERCVPPDDDESNFRMTEEHLLKKITMPSENIHRIKGEDNPNKEAVRYGEEVRSNLSYKTGLPLFDLIILGLGEDGHTASIFPNQMGLLNSQDICQVAVHPGSGQKRITLTGNVINNAAEVIFLVTGDSKKEILAEIINKSEKWKTYPAAHIHPVSGNLKWYVDKAAARLLQTKV